MRRLQFGLRTWLLLCLLLSVLLGLGVNEYLQYQAAEYRKRVALMADLVARQIMEHVERTKGDLPKSWADMPGVDDSVRAQVRVDFSITVDDVRRDEELILQMVKPVDESVLNLQSAHRRLRIAGRMIQLWKRPLIDGR